MSECNKISYISAEDAKKDVKVMTAGKNKLKGSGRGKVKKLKPYKCPHCDYWHLTSISKAASRRIEKHFKKLAK